MTEQTELLQYIMTQRNRLLAYSYPATVYPIVTVVKSQFSRADYHSFMLQPGVEIIQDNVVSINISGETFVIFTD